MILCKYLLGDAKVIEEKKIVSRVYTFTCRYLPKIEKLYISRVEKNVLLIFKCIAKMSKMLPISLVTRNNPFSKTLGNVCLANFID